MVMVRSEPRTAGRRGSSSPRGAAAVELAFLLPFICYLGMATVDYARLFYASTTITNCARNAAMYAAYPSGFPQFSSVQVAGQADSSSLNNPEMNPNYPINPVTITQIPQSIDANGNPYVGATASYTFQTVISYPGIPSSVTLSKTVYMPVHP
jgi:Flp pilus assembly protein TadG